MLQFVNVFSHGGKKFFSRFLKHMLIISRRFIFKTKWRKMSMNGIRMAAFLALGAIGCASTGAPSGNNALGNASLRATQSELAIKVCTEGAARNFNAAVMANPEINAGDRVILNNALLGATQQCVDNAEGKFTQGILALGAGSRKEAGAAAKSARQEVAKAICSDGITGHAAELLGDAKVGESALGTLSKALLDVADGCIKNVQLRFKDGVCHISPDNWRNYLVTLKR